MPVRGKTTEKTEKAPEVKETTTDTTAPKTVQKSPLEEKVKKFLDEVNPTIKDKIQEKLERVVASGGEKTNVLFLRFSKNASDEEVDDEVNVETIKEILFAFHTMPENHKSGKALMVEIVPKTEDDPHTMCFYEVS